MSVASAGRCASLHLAQIIMPATHHSVFYRLDALPAARGTTSTVLLIIVTFLVPAHPGSPRQRAIKWVCVCVYI